MILKEVPCPDCRVNVVFQIDLESQEVKDKPIFTLTKLHNEGTSVLQVSFDRNLSARRVRCFKLHETSEGEISSSAQIDKLLNEMNIDNSEISITIAKMDILDFSLAESLAYLLFPNIVYFDRLEEEVSFANRKLTFNTRRIRTKEHIKKVKDELKKVNGIIFLLRAESLTEEKQNLFLKTIDQISINSFIAACPIISPDLSNNQETQDKIIDQVSALVFSSENPTRSVAFFSISIERPETILDLFSWVITRKTHKRS